MKLLKKYLFVLVLFCGLDAAAQVKEQEPDKDFNALEHSLQKRYRFKGERFQSPKWYENSFISVYGGGYQLFKDDGGTYSMGGKAGLAVGKWFDEVSGLRLAGYGNTYKVNMTAERAVSWGLDVSYMYNLTSNIRGEATASRFYDIFLIGGAGISNPVFENDSDFNIGGHLGANLNLNLFKYLGFYFEPLARYEYTVPDRKVSDEGRSHHFSYNVNFGLTYNFIGREYDRYQADYSEGQFISLLGGTQMDILNMTSARINFKEGLGPNFALSYGKWYSGLFALRSSLFYSNGVWSEYIERFTNRSQYFGFRLEAMFEFLHYINDGKFPLRLSVLLGPEVGGMHKTDINETIFTPYFGFATGLQLKTRIAGPVSIFIEPRLSVVPYSFKTSGLMDSDMAHFNYGDLVGNLNLGIEIAL